MSSRDVWAHTITAEALALHCTVLRGRVGRSPTTALSCLRGRVSPHTVLRGSARWHFSNFGWTRPHDFDSLSYCGKSLGQCGKTVPSGESIGCPYCAEGQCEGSLGQTLGCPQSLSAYGFPKYEYLTYPPSQPGPTRTVVVDPQMERHLVVGDTEMEWNFVVGDPQTE